MSQALRSKQDYPQGDSSVAAIRVFWDEFMRSKAISKKHGDTLCGHLSCARCSIAGEFPRGHHELAVQLGDLGQFHLRMNRFPEAREYLTPLSGDDPVTLSQRSSGSGHGPQCPCLGA